MGACDAVEGKGSILLNWQPAFQQGSVEGEKGVQGHSGSGSVCATAECSMDGSKACEGCLMFLSESGLGGFQKSILVLSLNYRQTPALKNLSMCW